jgi:hypothetical protein
MAQLNQLLTSGSNVATPPAGYLAMFFGPSNSIGFKDANGVIIEPTASLTAVTASLAIQAEALTPGNKTVQGNLTVTGALTAREYIVSSSVTNILELNASGSSKFGDSLDDTHQMTGSLLVTGSANIVGPLNATSITGSLQGNVIGNITGSISGSNAQFTSITGSFSGSITGNIVGNVTGSISGSTAQFSSITGSISGSTAQFSSITGSISGSTARFTSITGSISGSTAQFLSISGSISGSTSLFTNATSSNIQTNNIQAFGNLIQGNNNVNQTGSNVALFGNTNTARAIYSTIAGFQNETTLNGNNTFVAGRGNIADAQAQTVVGYFNVSSSNVNDVFIVGGGISGSRKNIAVFNTGSVIISGSLNVSGSVTATIFSGSLSGIAATASFLNPLTQSVTILNNASNSTALTLLGSGSFSAGNIFDFIRVQNTNAGVPTPFKFFRVNSSGSFDIVNSAYDTPIFILSDSGSLTVTSVTSSVFSGSTALFTRLTASNASLTNTTLLNPTVLISNTPNDVALYMRGSGSTDSGSRNFDALLLENTNPGVPTPLKYIRLNPSGALEILNNAKSQIFTLSNSGSLNILNDVTASNVWANSNGTGKNFAIGDDGYLGEINVSNTLQFIGRQDETKMYLKFASGSVTPTLWTTGSNTLNLSGSFILNPGNGTELQVTNTGVTIGNSLADTHRITGSFLVTGSTHVNGDIKVGNIGTNPSPAGENALSVYPPALGGTGEGGQILLAASGGLYTSASMIDTYQNRFRVLKGTNTGGSTNEYLSVDLQTGGVTATSISSSFSGSLNGATIDNGSWIAYTPTWTATSNPVIGNGTLTGAYKVIGKTCFVRGSIAMGSSTTFGSGEWHIGLPFTASNSDGIQLVVSILDAGSAWYNAQMNGARAGFTNRSAVQYVNISNGTADSVSSASPITWASGDRLMWNGSYEIA